MDIFPEASTVMTRRKCIAQICMAAGMAAVSGVESVFASGEQDPTVARFWHRDGKWIQCELCPHGCLLSEGKTGICRNRHHRDGRLVALGYGAPCAVNVDPIEKKPFYHVLPGSRTFSLGVAGCNLRCKNCQNYTISQKSPTETENVRLLPEQAVATARENGCPVIAFTYTEPSVWIEYVIDTSIAAHQSGCKTALVSSGYINKKPFLDCAQYLDYARFDLKSFSDATYRQLNAGTLQPVLDTIVCAKKKGIWVEIINLVIPGWNDTDEDIRSLSHWVSGYCGNDTPVHFSRFFPVYQLSHGVPTPVATLEKAVAIASAEGLHYTYVGNVATTGSTTVCPKCGKDLVKRDGYRVTITNLKNGVCGYCGFAIAGIWK